MLLRFNKYQSIVGIIIMIVACFITLVIAGISSLPVIEPSSQKAYPLSLQSLVTQTEDHRFLSHRGIDLYGITRAAYYNVVHGQIIQGGSTIPQQLLKHYWGHTARTWQHKIQEIRGAILLTATNSKLSTITYYLDHVPFPNGGVVGYHQACTYYFDKQCNQLFESQLLFLIAVAQDGSNPYHERNFDRIKRLRDQLCSKTDQDCSVMSELHPQTAQELSWHDDSLDPRTRIVIQDYPTSMFDLDLTHRIDALIRTNRGLLEQHQAHDCCIVVIGTSGQIISYNQCRAYDERVGTVDMCRTRRQTGSAIKPWIYDLAFRRFGYTGGTSIMDEPVSYDLGDGSIYQPKNFDNQYHGQVTLAQALGNSFNIPAIKLTDQLGVASIVSMINQLRYAYGQDLSGLESDKGIFTPNQLGLSVGLGTYELSPLEFARLWRYWYDGFAIDVVKQEIIDIISNPLNRIISFGQDNLLNRAGWFVKTGTSRKFVDGRTCGGRVDQELIVCVRVGNHDVSSMDSSSVDTAGYLWYLTTQLVDSIYLTK